MKKAPAKPAQLAFPELTFLNSEREDVFLDLLKQNINNSKYLRTRTLSSVLTPEVTHEIADFMTASLTSMSYWFFASSRYNDKYKSYTRAQIHESSTVTPDHILYTSVPNPTEPAELMEWYMRQESRINGLILGYKDFTKGREDMVKGITQNLRFATLLLKNSI